MSVSAEALFAQLLLGLINVINFAHGALYMLGAFIAWGLLHYAGIGYWAALIISPLVVGALGIVLERTMLQRLYRLDPLYNLLLTFGLALIIQGLFQRKFGSSGEPYAIPALLQGTKDLGFMSLPYYYGWVTVLSLVVC